MRFIFLSIFSISTFSSPWIDTHDKSYYEDLSNLAIECNIDYLGHINSYPISLGEISYYIERHKLKEISEECSAKLEAKSKEIKTYFYESQSYIGYQSGYDGIYHQQLGKRYYKNSNIFASHSLQNKKFFLKLKISKDLDLNKTYLDESFGSLKLSNFIFSVGRINRWWSPSENTSLILSNSARPAAGLEIKNYMPINSNKRMLKLLGPINFEVFVNKLEKDRHIRNTLLFGNRVSIKPLPNLDISFLRLAQFGGDGRSTDSNTIINMLIGRDNTSKNLSFENQPGNQLAGADFSYSPKNNLNIKIYGQIMGEDEAGYLPSRTFFLTGFKYKFQNNLNPTYISFDYTDTYNGYHNMTYNHSLYKDGLRHLGRPIGASIDADSNEFAITIQQKKSNKFSYKLTLSQAEININNSQKNTWSDEYFRYLGADLNVSYIFNKLRLDLIYSYKDNTPLFFDKSSVFMRLIYNF